MKTATIIFGFIMLPFIGTTESFPLSNHLSGVWTSKCGQLTLILDYTYSGLRVRTRRNGSWDYYHQENRRGNTFTKGLSKKIKVRSSNKIRFEDRYARVKLDLYKVNGSNYYNNNDYGYSRGDGGRTGTYNNYPNSNSRYTGYPTGLESYDAKKLRRSIDDKWINREYRVKVKIKDTDSGIKLKRDGDKEYYHYLQDRRNPRFFADARGNTVEIVNKYEIVWHDTRRGKTLYFSRD